MVAIGLNLIQFVHELIGYQRLPRLQLSSGFTGVAYGNQSPTFHSFTTKGVWYLVKLCKLIYHKLNSSQTPLIIVFSVSCLTKGQYLGLTVYHSKFISFYKAKLKLFKLCILQSNGLACKRSTYYVVLPLSDWSD